MTAPASIQRVIIVVLDGLRADAVHLFPLPNMARLAERGAHTFSARTVTPSVTAAAMTSLFTGVAPAVHGLTSDRFGIPRAGATLTPLTRVLQRAALPSSAYMATLPRPYRALAARIARALGIDRVTFHGHTAADVLAASRDTLTTQRRGLIFLHWPDADRVGHAHGWTSDAYAVAASRLDDTLGALVCETRVIQDPRTLLIVCSDHGGGGMHARSHDSLHPQDQRIPLILLGGAVRAGRLTVPCSLLDVPATTCWALGVTTPSSYGGRALLQAFHGHDERTPRPMAAVA